MTTRQTSAPKIIQTYTHNSPKNAETITLRDYQKPMVADTYQHIRNGIQKILMVAIMGAGKTVIASWIMRDAVSKGKRCVFLVALNVLLDQTAETLRELGVNCTILQGDRPVDESAPVVIASLQTIGARMRRGKSPGALLGYLDLAMADEAHITAYDANYEAIEAHYLELGTTFIGLTATPWRRSKKEWLGQKFDALVVGPQPPEIIKVGGAVPCRGYTLTGAIDLDTLRVSRGDYVDSDVADQANREEALEYVVAEWKRLCSTRPTLMIGATVEQAQRTRDRFIAHGIAAELIVGTTSADERKAIFERVKVGQTQVITSVGCLTAGFNLPCISAILYVRATKSKALFHQSAGRGSRPSGGKSDYLLLDFGGNLKRHGNPMAFQDYDISQPHTKESVCNTKTCPECSTEVIVFAHVCRCCGFEFVESGADAEQLEALMLKQLNEFVDKLAREKIRDLRRWRKEAYKGDRSPDEGINQFTTVYGHTPPSEWLLHACLTKRYSQKRKTDFLAYLERHCNIQSRWAGQWLEYHLRLEFGTADIDQLELFLQWHHILEVEPDVDWATIKQAYSAKVEEFNPDHYPGSDAEARIERLNLALEDARVERITIGQPIAVGGAK